MSDAVSASADHELQMLGALVKSAFALSETFAAAAKVETDHTRRLELFDAFCQGSRAVRMGIRLSMALRAAPKAAPAARDAAQPERPDPIEGPEIPEAPEREREREYEPVSLPKFLATLGVVAAETERLADRLPVEATAEALPALRGLLSQAKAAPATTSPSRAPTGSAAAVALLTRPPGPAPQPLARAPALLGSVSAPPARPLALRGANLARPPPRPPR